MSILLILWGAKTKFKFEIAARQQKQKYVNSAESGFSLLDFSHIGQALKI